MQQAGAAIEGFCLLRAPVAYLPSSSTKSTIDSTMLVAPMAEQRAPTRTQCDAAPSLLTSTFFFVMWHLASASQTQSNQRTCQAASRDLGAKCKTQRPKWQHPHTSASLSLLPSAAIGAPSLLAPACSGKSLPSLSCCDAAASSLTVCLFTSLGTRTLSVRILRPTANYVVRARTRTCMRMYDHAYPGAHLTMCCAKWRPLQRRVCYRR